jgi:hypothetical protein
MLPSNSAARTLQHETAINILNQLGSHLESEGVLRKPGKEKPVREQMDTLRSGGKAQLEKFDANALSTMLKRMCLQGYVLIPHGHYTEGAAIKDPNAQAAFKKAVELMLDVAEHGDKNLMTLESVAAAAKSFFEAKPASRTPWGRRREEAKANAAMIETSKKQEEDDRIAVRQGADRTAAPSGEKADPQILAFLQAAQAQRGAQRAQWAQSAPKIGDITKGFGENISTEDFFKT